MTDRDKVISRLQIIRTWAEVGKNYNGIQGEGCLRDIVDWIDDALELLKEQEPRVLALEEVMQYIGYSEKIPPKSWEKLPLWTESRDGTGVFSGYRDILNLHNLINMGEIDKTYVAYKHWRCWSAKPTDEQRESVKWVG